VLRVSPPLVIGEDDARESLACLRRILQDLADELAGSARRAVRDTVTR
jgi:hypothetical protein